MIGSPTIGQHLIKSRIVSVQSQQDFAQVGPRFDPMSLCSSKDGVQNGGASARLFAAQKEPIFSANGLVPQRSFADVVVNGKPPVFGIASKCPPLVLRVRHSFAQSALGSARC